MHRSRTTLRSALATLAVAALAALTIVTTHATPALAQTVPPQELPPEAVDVTVSIASTTPPQAVTVTLHGSDYRDADAPAFTIVATPVQGTVTVPPSEALCAISLQPQPLEDATRPTIWPPQPGYLNCSAEVQYTPAAGATGLDSFTYTFANGGRTSAVATVTVRLPGAGAEGTFDRPLEDPGINPAVWNGGTTAQLSAATSAAGGTTVTTFVDGKPVVLVPGAPPFVAAPFDQAYPQGYVAAGTIVFVAR